MTNGKYEIDVDLDAEDPSSHMDMEETNSQSNIRSAVSKKKGRGFSSAEENKRFVGVSQFDSLSGDNIGRAQKSVEGWIVFVTGIHEECTEDDLYDKFADFGPIKDMKMPLDHRTGYVKGYALIEYATHEEAKSAVDNMNGQMVMEQPVKCDFAFIRGSGTSRSYEEDAGQDGGEREVVRTGRSNRDTREVVEMSGDGSGREIKVYHDI